MAPLKSRSGIARRSGLLSLLVVSLMVMAWLTAGAFVQPRMLSEYREDYEDARFAKDHPFLVRMMKEEEAIRASEAFARDYEALEQSGVFMAPIRAISTSMSHSAYQELVNPTERQQFEKERKEREKQEREEDEKRLRAIREKERAKND